MFVPKNATYWPTLTHISIEVTGRKVMLRNVPGMYTIFFMNPHYFFFLKNILLPSHSFTFDMARCWNPIRLGDIPKMHEGQMPDPVQ